MKILFSFATLLAVSFGAVHGHRTEADEPAAPRKSQPKKGATSRSLEGAKPADSKNPNETHTNRKDAESEVKAQEKKELAKKELAKEVPPLNLDSIFQPLRALFGGGPAAVAVPAENAADVEAQLNALNEQYLQQLTPIRTAELAFVRLLCSDLTPDQRHKIKVQADAGLKQAARQMADQQNQQQRGGGGGIRVNTMNPEPQKVIRDAIANVVKQTLTPAQWTRYTAEAEARVAIRKRTAIQSVVSRLDDQLLLTPEQREKVTQSLTSQWQPTWEKWTLMSQMYGDRYFPVVPDQCITTHLTDEQKSVWQGIQKVDIGWWMNQGQENLEDEWWNVAPFKGDAPDEGQPQNLRFRPTEIFR